MLFLFCVALWFILRGASCLVLPCSLSSRYFSPFSIVITSLGEEGAGLICTSSAFVCLGKKKKKKKKKIYIYIYIYSPRIYIYIYMCVCVCVCVFQVSALKKLGMVGRHKILFCRNILYRNCILQYISPHFPQI